ncbi:MAG: hypothetical protein J4F39_11290 [Candidatus Latescibacteria bacterium]|nr:hypothetical protein [Candidatus Latescibacterota bacterium]
MFDTSLFDRALRKRIEERSRERAECLRSVIAALKRIRNEYDVREAYVTGSLVVENRWNEASDVDVAVGGCSGSILDVMKVLEDASGRVVDVIDLDTHPYPGTVRDRGLTVYG